jgi:hypothetical protein
MPQRLYPPARPQSAGAVLDSAFHILAASWLRTLPYGILISLVGQLPNIYGLIARRPAAGGPLAAQRLVLAFISVALIVALWAALLLRQRAIAQGEPRSMLDDFTELTARLPALMGLLILTWLAIVAGSICLLLPGVYLLIALSVAQCAVLFERLDPLAAMKRSLQLVRGHWWRTLGIFVVAVLIVFVFDILGVVVVTILVRFVRGADVALLSAAARMIIIVLGTLTTPFIAATTLCIYGELQLRHAPRADAEGG